jgi:hypothetical protein
VKPCAFCGADPNDVPLRLTMKREWICDSCYESGRHIVDSLFGDTDDAGARATEGHSPAG